MPQFKVKNTNTGNEFYFQTDRIDVVIKILRGGLVSYADRSREMQFEEAIFTVEIEGVWTVPSGRSHPGTTPKSAEQIWAMALREAGAGNPTEIFPEIQAGFTEGGIQADGSHSAGSTSISVETSGSNFDVRSGDTIEFDGHEDEYVVKNGASGSSGTLTIWPYLNQSVSDNEDIDMFESPRLSVLPKPGGGPAQKQTEKGADRLKRSVAFESDQTYDDDAHIWRLLSAFTDAL